MYLHMSHRTCTCRTGRRPWGRVGSSPPSWTDPTPWQPWARSSRSPAFPASQDPGWWRPPTPAPSSGPDDWSPVGGVTGAQRVDPDVIEVSPPALSREHCSFGPEPTLLTPPIRWPHPCRLGMSRHSRLPPRSWKAAAAVRAGRGRGGQRAVRPGTRPGAAGPGHHSSVARSDPFQSFQSFGPRSAKLATVLAGRKEVPRTGEGRGQVCVERVLSFLRSPAVRRIRRPWRPLPSQTPAPGSGW